LARLFATLAAHDLLDSTVIVITSDHGESLGEQDYWFEHGRNASEATVKVPLIVRLPAQSAWQPQLTKVAGEARLADVTPTLLEWLALPPLASLGARVDVGQSLASAWRAGALPVQPIACEKVERAGLTGAVQTKVVRVWPWRLERRLARDAQGNLRGLSESLYNLAEDPSCARDLLAQADQAGAPLAELRAELDSRVRADAGLSELGDELERRRLELLRKRPADARTIEALGY
jgi:arylsulfatase A-like enzyme